MERCCEESDEGWLWTQSTHQREALGLTLSGVNLMKMEECEEKLHYHTIIRRKENVVIGMVLSIVLKSHQYQLIPLVKVIK